LTFFQEYSGLKSKQFFIDRELPLATPAVGPRSSRGPCQMRSLLVAGRPTGDPQVFAVKCADRRESSRRRACGGCNRGGSHRRCGGGCNRVGGCGRRYFYRNRLLCWLRYASGRRASSQQDKKIRSVDTFDACANMFFYLLGLCEG